MLDAPDEPMFPTLPADPGSAKADEALRKLLLISLHGSVVAVPAAPIVEVLSACTYARLPGALPSVAGLVNRRGRMLTVVDLGIALDSAPATAAEEHRVVVVSYGGRELGLAVKDVLQITTDWWSESFGEAESAPHAGAAEYETDLEEGGPEADEVGETLRVVEFDSVFAPLFGGGRGRG